MSNEIIKVLDALAEKFGIVVDWTTSNIQPYVQELASRAMRWKIGISIMWLVVGLIALLSVIPCIKFIKYCDKIQTR